MAQYTGFAEPPVWALSIAPAGSLARATRRRD